MGRVSESGDGEARGQNVDGKSVNESCASIRRRLTVSRPPLLAHSAGLTGAATLVSRILGLLRSSPRRHLWRQQ